MRDPDSAAYLACFLDAAISAAAPADDADAEMYESASVVATVTSHLRDRRLCQGISRLLLLFVAQCERLV